MCWYFIGMGDDIIVLCRDPRLQTWSSWNDITDLTFLFVIKKNVMSNGL